MHSMNIENYFILFKCYLLKKAKHIEKMLIEMLTHLAIKCSEGLLEKKDAQWSLGETIMEDLSTAYDYHL